MPLLMPFYFDYDLLLLVVPITLYAAERVASPNCARRQDRWFTTGWALLFLWLYFNPAFALHTHVSGTVLLLSSVSILSIRRANRVDDASAPMPLEQREPLAIAA